MKMQTEYPFKAGWLFDEYKSTLNLSNTQINHSHFIQSLSHSIKQLELRQIIIENFNNTHHSLTNFFNPSIIRIDTIPNYYKYMLQSINTHKNINIIKRVIYLLIGRANNNNQCDISMKIKRNWSKKGNGGLILLDNNWNILSYITIKSNISNHMEDCRLFVHLSLVFMDCMSYWQRGNFIMQLLWKEENNQIVSYLQVKQLMHKPIDNKFGIMPKNLIPLSYNNTLYFQWNLKHSYFISLDLSNVSDQNKVFAYPAYYNNMNFSSKLDIFDVSYHGSCGFIHLLDSNEFLGIGHMHYDLFSRFPSIPKVTRFGSHYVQFFYTIEDKPPFHIKRMSESFCIISAFKNQLKCDIIQFVLGMVENTVNDVEYLFISYGINDCIGSIAAIRKTSVISMLKDIQYQ